VEARGQGRVGGNPGGATNAMRGSASSNRVTPACLVRTPWMRKSLKSGLGADVLADVQPSHSQRHEGKGTSRGAPRYRGGKPSESESPRALPA
jgi:hypothetical protein